MLKLDLPYPADQVDDVQVYSYAEPPYQDVPSMLINFVIDAEGALVKLRVELFST